MDPTEYDHPDWASGGHVHNWRRYISQELRDMWDGFSAHQKQAIAASAEEAANNEVWD